MSAIIGLGSNLEGPEVQVTRALDALNSLPDTRLLKKSSLYSSRPQGPQDQANFVNAVAEIHTSLQPLSLLKALQALEQEFGRVKTRHWGERVLDLDIIFFDGPDFSLRSEELTIPHPMALSRDFVLVPLLEIIPDFTGPTGHTIRYELDRIENHGLELIIKS